MPRQKLVVISIVLAVLLLSAFAFKIEPEFEQVKATINPGAYAFASSSIIPRIIKKYYSLLEPIISKRIVIPREFTAKGITVKNAWVDLGITEDSFNVEFNEEQNVLAISISDLSLNTQADFTLKKSLFNFSGSLNVVGTIKQIRMVCKMTTYKGRVGTTPQLEILSNGIDIDSDKLEIKIHGTILKILQPIFNNNLFNIKSWQINSIKERISNKGLLNRITEFINNEIDKSMTDSISIPKFGISMSVLPDSAPKIKKNGVEFLLDGIIFPTIDGYERLTECSAMSDAPLLASSSTSDVVAQVGPCAFDALIDTLVKNKYTQKIEVGKNAIITGDTTVKMVQWDQQGIWFTRGNQAIARVGLELNMSVMNKPVTVIVNLTGDFTFKKASDITGLVWSSEQDRFLVEADKVGTLLMELEVTEINDLYFAHSILPSMVEWSLKELLTVFFKFKTLKNSVDIPQICMFRESCLKNFYVQTGDGYLEISLNFLF